MQNDKGKYVPPPLRGGAGSQESSYSGGRSYGGGYGRDDGGYRGGGGYRDRDGPRGGYDNRGGYDRQSYSRGGWGNDDGRSGGYDGPMNSRWKSFESGGSGGGGYRGGYSGYGSGYAPRVNSKGYHGDERPNPRVEAELFNSDSQPTGINFDKYDDIPVEVSEGCPEPYNEFTLETLGEQLLRNVHLAKFSKPTPVQKYSIPIGLAGGDMMACAQTGSGKTAGFLFPIITGMLHFGPLKSNNPTAYRTTHPTALILAPTRELAVQIQEEAQKFCYCTGIRSVVVYGGANIQNQMRDLERGADILVATPGRLVDLIERDRISLDIIRYLILDEADRMLDMGFEPQIRRIVEGENMPTSRQTFMFSATFPVEIQRLAADFMKDYIFLAVGRVGAASKDVNQSIVWVEQHAKMDYILDFLNSMKTNDGLILIFVETKRGADTLEQRLRRLGFPAASIHGDKSQREREDALRYFKNGECPILVATDVAARGLDIPHVTQVINFDLPSNIDDYVHRIGRTGRVGNIGYALSLMNDKNRNISKDLAELLLENDLDCPHWLEKMYQSSFGGGGRGRGRGRGGGRFGSRDMRKDKGYSGFKMSQVSGPPSGSSGGYKQERHVPSDNSAW